MSETLFGITDDDVPGMSRYDARRILFQVCVDLGYLDEYAGNARDYSEDTIRERRDFLRQIELTARAAADSDTAMLLRLGFNHEDHSH